jgi:hypothetical protein
VCCAAAIQLVVLIRPATAAAHRHVGRMSKLPTMNTASSSVSVMATGPSGPYTTAARCSVNSGVTADPSLRNRSLLFRGDDLVEPLGDVGDQVCTARGVGEEVVAHLLVRAAVVGDRTSDGVVEVGGFNELLGRVDLLAR